MQLADVKLDDKYTLESGRVYLNGIQALTRLLMMQRMRDAAAGLNTAGFVSGFQGSPLNNMDKTLWEAHDLLQQHHIHFQPGQNEELAAMGVWGAQQVSLDPHARYQGVFGMWYGKWAGLARCGDVLLHGNSAGPRRMAACCSCAATITWRRSSTVATQSENMLMAPMIPVLAPSGVQEYLDLGIHGYAMSRYSGSWLAFKALDDTDRMLGVGERRSRAHRRAHSRGLHVAAGRPQPAPARPAAGDGAAHPRHACRRCSPTCAPTGSTTSRTTVRMRGWASSRRASRISTCARRSSISASTSTEAARIGIRVLKLGLTWPLEPQGCMPSRSGSKRSSWSRKSAR